MLRLLALIGFLLWASSASAQGLGPTNPILCNNGATLAAGSTGLTKIISGSPGKTIFICGWEITNTGASGTFSIVSGTQTSTACDTGAKTIVQPMNITSSAPAEVHSGYAGLSSLQGQDLCINPSVATIAALIFYSQF